MTRNVRRSQILYMNTLVSYLLPYLLSYLLTPYSTVLLDNLTGLQVFKKFPAFYGTRKFITVLTSVRHLSLSWASSIQSITSHSNSWRSILILSFHLRLGLLRGLFPQVSPPKPWILLSYPSCLLHVPPMCDKCVPVTTAWRVLRLRMEGRPAIWRVAANILNKQSRTADEGWSSSLVVGRGANNSSP